MELFWLIQALAFWSLVLLLVPLQYIKRLFLFAFIGGFLYTWIVQYIAVEILGLWHFKADVFTIWGIPVFFVLSWFAVTLLYSFLLFRYPKNQLWIIVFFVIWTTTINYVASFIKIIFLTGWGIPQTFNFAIFSHIFLLYLLKFMHKLDELGSKKNTIEFSLSILKNRIK